MSDNKYETSSINPGWIKKIVPDTYADDDLKRIVLFYVINTPCVNLSSSGISLSNYGWNKNVWKEGKLRSKLLSTAKLTKGKTFFVAEKIEHVKTECNKANMKKGFHKDRDIEKVVIYKPKEYNQFMAVLYHIRNAFAHGRLAMYDIKESSDIMFVLEDGMKKNGEFQVRSRMILKKSTLIKWIDLIEKKTDLEK